MFKKSNRATSASSSLQDDPTLTSLNQKLEDSLVDRFTSATDINQVVITPEEVLKFNASTRDYLCPKAANIYDIEFTRFRVRDFSAVQSQKSSKNKPQPPNA